MTYGSISRILERYLTVLQKKSKLSTFSRSPMCWLRNARLRRVRQIVFFSSPPTANLREFFVQSHRRWHVASRPPYLSQSPDRRANDRIVTTKENLSFMHKKHVGDAP